MRSECSSVDDSGASPGYVMRSKFEPSPEGSSVEEEKIKKISVSGRMGAMSAINGVYIERSQRRKGKSVYGNSSAGVVLFYNKNMWLFVMDEKTPENDIKPEEYVDNNVFAYIPQNTEDR
eukprot:UN25827